MKRRLKIILDVIMLLAALTLFNKQLISMNYHEIAGLVLIALVIVHIIINVKTVTAMCKKFIRVPAAIKAGLIVDILLLLCFICLGISGILISKTILTSISSTNMIFKLLHMFTGGLSVILLGIHIGLHVCRKPFPTPYAVIASGIILILGIYGITNSNEIRWLSTPFQISSQPDQSEHFNGPMNDDSMQSSNGNGETQEHKGYGKQMHGNQNQNGKNADEFGSDHQLDSGEGNMHSMQKNRPSLSLFQKLQNVGMFLGMLLSCTVITYWITIPKRKKCNSQPKIEMSQK